MFLGLEGLHPLSQGETWQLLPKESVFLFPEFTASWFAEFSCTQAGITKEMLQRWQVGLVFQEEKESVQSARNNENVNISHSFWFMLTGC